MAKENRNGIWFVVSIIASLFVLGAYSYGYANGHDYALKFIPSCKSPVSCDECPAIYSAAALHDQLQYCYNDVMAREDQLDRYRAIVNALGNKTAVCRAELVGCQAECSIGQAGNVSSEVLDSTYKCGINVVPGAERGCQQVSVNSDNSAYIWCCKTI
jgi:hypothetical protein